MNLYDEVMSAGPCPGIYDEAFTRLIEDLKIAVDGGLESYHWTEDFYPATNGQVMARCLPIGLPMQVSRLVLLRNPILEFGLYF